MRAPTGTQHELTLATPSGQASATITEVGAGLRSYSIGGIELVESFPADSTPPKGAGIVLVPWPNRIRDGRWSYGGAVQQLALTEPAKGNASHGLLRHFPYREAARTAGSVTLEAPVFPQPGYPFQLDTSVAYSLTADGLDVTHRLRNLGPTDAPVAVGAHPYLRIGDVPSGDLLLTVAASTHIDVDERMNAVGESSVDGTPLDLRGGRRVGELDLDDGFGGTQPGVTVEHSLAAPDGRRLILWGDEQMRYVQVFTPRAFPGTGGPHQAVAIEPMTAPADAFNSGKGLRWLAPDTEWTVRWGIRHTGFGV
ncbi:aldose 1-epimerase family protein [Glaciibacter sp. 2TAF33]|uniref:aldose 1-epimerase family protein n=1 Tax=Glaciibacter sp. 2TAF33 TaxID=3233015 RepID=UPI003F8E1798